MNICYFRSAASSNSFDPETRSFTVIAATDAPVDRGDHIEIIDLDAFLASGLPESLPLQMDHSSSARDTIGRLRNFRVEQLEGGIRGLVAEAILSSREDNAVIAANLKDGAQTGFSVGFSVTHWQKGKDPHSGKPMRRAVAGRFVEGSLVVDPADPNATIRSKTMPPEIEDELEIEIDEVVDDAGDTDRLRALAVAAGVSEETINEVLASDANNEDKMKKLLSSLAAKPAVRSATHHNNQTLDNPIVLRRAAIEAFDALNRGATPTGPASAVFAQGEAAFARRLLRNAGQSVSGLSDTLVMRNAAATSDYAIIAGGTFNLSMRREYEATVSPIASLFGETTVETFNKETSGLVDWTTLAIGDKLENGHYKHSYVDESGETIFVSTIGGVTSITRELSINAGSRLGDMGAKYGRRLAADLAERQVTFLEQDNGAGPKMADGKAVFDASRSNISPLTIQAPAHMVTELMTLRSRMARRKGKGNVIIGEYPTHWLVDPEFEASALQIVASVAASAIADVNPMAGKLQVVAEPRLTRQNTSWLIAEPSKMDGATRVLLKGNEAPFTDSRQNFDTDTIDFKIRQDFGLGWLEWRSWTRLDHGE